MDTRALTRERLRIDDLLLDPGRHELTRDGVIIELPRLSYQLLLALAEAAPNVVTQDELMERVWPDRVVSPETLTQRIKLLRQAIGDDAHAPRYIGLVRGEGYRLLPPVTREYPGVAEVRATWIKRHPVLTIGGLLLIVASLVTLLTRIDWGEPQAPLLPASSIAVLPFSNLSGDPADDYLSAGLANELQDQLGRVKGLRIVPRRSAAAAREGGRDAQAMALQMGVGTLVEGSLRRQGNNLSITIQVIDGNTGFQRWSQSYDRTSRDLLAIPQQIAQDVVKHILPDVETSGESLSPTSEDVSAHELLSRLGGALLYRGDIDAAEDPIFTALGIDPDLSEVQTTLGLYYWLRGLPGSGDAWQRAIEINPYNADALAYYAYWIWHQWDYYTGDTHYRRALSIDPLSLSRHADLGNFYGMMGQTEQTAAIAARVEAMFPTAEGYSLLARLYELMGRVDDAIAWAIKAQRADPERERYTWQLAELYAVLGDFNSALLIEPKPGMGLLFRMRRYEEMISLGEELMIDQPQDLTNKYLLAFAYNATGQYELAVRMLKLAGLPERALADTRDAPAIEALATLANALYLSGQTEPAQRLAKWIYKHMQIHQETGGTTWWGYIYKACASHVLGEHERVLESLAGVTTSPRLPWLPLLQDSPCFAPYRDSPRFKSLLDGIDKRRAALLKNLPNTLHAHGLDVRTRE